MSEPAHTASTEPATPLRLPPREQGWRNTLWVVVGIIAFGALLAACAIYQAPVLISDWQVRETVQPVPNARVSDGDCTSKLIIHICSATLSLNTPQGSVTRNVNYLFSGLHTGDYNVEVLADPAHPELVTTDLGLDRLWNRTITLLVISGILAAMIIGAVLGMVRDRRRAAREAM